MVIGRRLLKRYIKDLDLQPVMSGVVYRKAGSKDAPGMADVFNRSRKRLPLHSDISAVSLEAEYFDTDNEDVDAGP